MNYRNSMEGYSYWQTPSVQGYSEQMYVQSTAAAVQVTSSQQGTMTSHFDEDIFRLLDDQDLSFLSTYYDDNSTLQTTNESHVSMSSNDSFNDAKSPSMADSSSPANWYVSLLGFITICSLITV